MTCPNCDLSGWHVEARDDEFYRVVDGNGAVWCHVKKSCQGGAQERAHIIAEAMQAREAKEK